MKAVASSETDTDSDDDTIFKSRMNGAKEATQLLDAKSKMKSEEKLSGKAWGRVKNFCSCNSDYPKSVFFIVGNEFCERFSFYGMKAILVIYLTKYLLFSDNRATATYHGFNMLCYFTPIFGAMLADGFLGKYKTILYISIIYCIGNLVMALTALPPPEAVGPLIGLLLIGIGTGGIKPCVSAFGGDQFSKDQDKQLQGFFSVFYFAINAGSLISTFLTPILRADVHCLGSDNCDDCYPLAFGVPAALMFVSLVLFFSGRNLYKRYPPRGNVVGKVAMATGSALKSKWKNGRNGGDKKEHWLHYAENNYEMNFLNDVRAVYKVLFLFFPLPVFWALFDQQGSRWTLQAESMNGDIGIPGWNIKPDQMQVLNPILIIVLIPIFENIVYPLLNKCRIPNRPLQRMVAGMILASAAFVIAGFIQIKIDSTEVPLTKSESDVVIINTSPCPVNIQSGIFNGTTAIQNSTQEMRVNSSNYDFTFSVDSSCTKIAGSKNVNIKLESEQSYSVIITNEGKNLVVKNFPSHLGKAEKGKSIVSVIYTAEKISDNMTVHLHNEQEPCKSYEVYNVSHLSASSFSLLEPGKYDVYVEYNGNRTYAQQVKVQNGGVYTMVIQQDHKDNKLIVLPYANVLPNVVSMLLLMPQYCVITTGEIMFSITGLSFAYSQAPLNMKSVLQASWLLTVAFGNLIVVIVAETSLLPQYQEFFVFAGLMGATIIVFSIMAYFYEYVYYVRGDDESDGTGLVNMEQLEIAEDEYREDGMPTAEENNTEGRQNDVGPNAPQ